MLSELAHQAEDAAARTAQTAFLGLGASIALAVGAGFLTLAAWLFLVQVSTVLLAAVILGAAYFGIGLILLATISARRRARERQRARERAENSSSGIQQLALAFLTGLRAGRSRRRGSSGRR